MNENIKVEDIIEGTYSIVGNRKFIPAIEYLTKGLPRIIFTWVEEHYVQVTDEEEDLLISKGLLSKREHYEGTGKRGFLVVKVRDKQVVTTTVTFCNFRRYSWSWALHESRDGYGFGCGPVYANGTDGGVQASSPEQVVRDTFILALAKLPVPNEIVRSLGVRPLLERLLKDAIDNVSGHAERCAGNSVGGINAVNVTDETGTTEWR